MGCDKRISRVTGTTQRTGLNSEPFVSKISATGTLQVLHTRQWTSHLRYYAGAAFPGEGDHDIFDTTTMEILDRSPKTEKGLHGVFPVGVLALRHPVAAAFGARCPFIRCTLSGKRVAAVSTGSSPPHWGFLPVPLFPRS